MAPLTRQGPAVRVAPTPTLRGYLNDFTRFLPDGAPDDLPEWLRSVVFYAGDMHPDLAELLLCYNTSNRREKRRAIEVYKRKMKELRWVFTGEAILFARTRRGTRLLDGQNRLRACVESGESFPCLIIDGIAESVFAHLNRGVRRTAADNLVAAGEKNAFALGAAANMLYRWERGLLLDRAVAVEPDDVKDTVSRHPDLRTSIQAVYGSTQLVRSHGAAGFLHYEFSRRDPNLADWFFRALADPIGENVDKTQGVYWFWKMLDNDLKSSNRTRTAPEHIWASAVKAWNLHRSGKAVRNLNGIRWRPDRNEKFPEIR